MTIDAFLAIAHHLGVFGIAAVLAAEWALVRPGIRTAEIQRLGRVDAAYGALAGLVLIAGVARVFLGAKPADFYTGSATFWLKMAMFATVGALSIRPTIRYTRWRKAISADDPAVPPDEELMSARRAVNLQLAVFATIPVFAALMARGIGA